MITVNAMGDACPIPVVKTKNAIASLKGADVVETLVDNEIAVENLKKMADQKGYKTTSEKLEEGKYRVCIIVENVVDNVEKKDGDGGKFCDCTPEKESNKVVVIRSSVMGEGDPELGKVLLKGFIYAISQQKDLPKTMLFYNGGAFITKCTTQLMRDLGSIQSPQNAFILNLGLESLHVRMAKHCENGQAVAEFLEQHPKVAYVNYPGLPSNKYYERAKKYMPDGGCGVVSFGLKGGREAASVFMQNLKLGAIETHVADARTCCLNPATSTHRQMNDEQLKEAGVPAELIRISLGLEDKEDLIADISAALDAIQ